MSEPLPTFEELSASLRADRFDARRFMRLLARKLLSELGREHVRVYKQDIRRQAPVKAIRVSFDNDLYLTLRHQPTHGLTAERRRHLPAEHQPITVLEWMDEVHRLTAAHAQHQERATAALRAGVEQTLGSG